MKTAGIRKARQNLSELIEEVRKGREVLLTDRGKPVAKLVPPLGESKVPFRSHKAIRRVIKLKGTALSKTVQAGREDRL